VSTKSLPPIFQAILAGSTKHAMLKGGKVTDLSIPYKDGPHVYATDGVIAVRFDPREAGIKVLGVARARFSLAGTINEYASGKFKASPVKLPSVEATARCRWCDGRVVGECPDCDGSGRVRNYEIVVLPGGLKLGAGYVALLREHKATVYPPVGPNAKTRPVRFLVDLPDKADAIEGYLMPIAPVVKTKPVARKRKARVKA
jgi:hypothetical protein